VERSAELAKLVDTQASFFDNPGQRPTVDRIVSRDSYDGFSVRHHHVFALSKDMKAGTLKSPHNPQVR
jgi:hypothetical protein